MMFSLWSLDKIIAAIIAIEEILASGQQSASSIQGSISFRSADDGYKVLKLLYAAKEAKETGESPNTGIRYFGMISHSEFT